MPKNFDICREQGGKIRTIKVSSNKYLHICIDSKGKSHPGEVKDKVKKK